MKCSDEFLIFFPPTVPVLFSGDYDVDLLNLFRRLFAKGVAVVNRRLTEIEASW